MIGEDISFFNGNIISPVGYLDEPFKMVDICYWRGIFIMHSDLVG